MKPREHPWSCNWDYWCISGMWWWLPSMLRNPIHSPTKQPKAGSPFIRTHAKGGIWSKPSHASMGSPICAMSPFVHLVVHFNHPWSMNPQLTALSTHDIMCNRNAYNERSSSIFRLSVLEKIQEGTHSGARASHCEQNWDLQPWKSHCVLTECCLTTKLAVKQACSKGKTPRDRSWFTQLRSWGKEKSSPFSNTAQACTPKTITGLFFFKTGKLSERKIRPFLSFF